MARRAMDQLIADYAEASRGEFKANELRRFVRATHTIRGLNQDRLFDEGDVIVVIDDDQGIMMNRVKILSKFGVTTIKRVSLTMNTEVVA
jgi:hypothetical protein